MTTEGVYDVLASRLGYPGSQRLRGVLAYMMDEEAARIAEALPGTPADIVQRTGFSEERVREVLEDLFHKGLAFPRGDFNSREYFKFSRGVGHMHDTTQCAASFHYEKDRRFYELWQDMVRHEFYQREAETARTKQKPAWRVVPAVKSIDGLPGVLPTEDFRALLKAQTRIAVVRCSCRYRSTAIGAHCAHTSEEEVQHCLQFERSADYQMARGAGRALTLAEALALVDQAEDDGLIHTWLNTAQMENGVVGCNCCRDCCVVSGPTTHLDLPLDLVWAKSRYIVELDETSCTNCGICADVCQFDAVSMREPTGGGTEVVIDKEKCFGCGICVIKCGPAALKMKAVRPPEHIPAAAGTIY